MPILDYLIITMLLKSDTAKSQKEISVSSSSKSKQAQFTH